jgi:hypothetical protein
MCGLADEEMDLLEPVRGYPAKERMEHFRQEMTRMFGGE